MFPMDRYFAAGERKVNADPNGDLVWFTDAEFNEHQAREQAIRDCIAAVEAVANYLPHRPADSLVNLPAVLAALRALLEGGSAEAWTKHYAIEHRHDVIRLLTGLWQRLAHESLERLPPATAMRGEHRSPACPTRRREPVSAFVSDTCASAHDPLCPFGGFLSEPYDCMFPSGVSSVCDVIARVRADAEAHEKAAVQQVIRDCIAAIEDTFGKRGVDSGAVLDECRTALRALLEGEK